MSHFIEQKWYVSAAAQYFICDDFILLETDSDLHVLLLLSSLFDCFVRLCSFDAWGGYLSICKTIRFWMTNTYIRINDCPPQAPSTPYPHPHLTPHWLQKSDETPKPQGDNDEFIICATVLFFQSHRSTTGHRQRCRQSLPSSSL